MPESPMSPKPGKAQGRILLFNLLWSAMYTIALPFLVKLTAQKSPKLAPLLAPLIIIIALHVLALFALGFYHEVKKNKDKKMGNLLSSGILTMLAPGNCLLAVFIYRLLGGG